VQDGLALGLIPGVGWRAAEIRRVAREAEEAGFAAVFAAEVNNDVLGTVELMGEATQRIKVGSWVAQHLPAAPLPALIADATGGRMLLGLGVSHQPVNSALDVGMGSPIGALRDYATAVASWLRGEGPATHLPQRPSTHPVPIYFGALTSPTVELAGEIADGIMPIWWSPERVARSRGWAERGRARSATRPKLQVALGLPTFVGEDMAALRALARANLGLFPNLPFFRRLLRASGFAAEADLAEQGRAEAALSDRVLEAICLMGPLSRCRQRLAEYRDAGVDLPILWPAVDFESARATVQAFCQ